jgi:hypothetical protein
MHSFLATIIRNGFFMKKRLVLLMALFLLFYLIKVNYVEAQSCNIKASISPITLNGKRLAEFLDHSNVDKLWLPHLHTDWYTGKQNKPGWSLHATYCSSFVASMAKRLHIKLLHPPEHPPKGLASAQFDWLKNNGAKFGWKEVDFINAQNLANQGYFVVAVYKNPNPHEPGHIAIIRPSKRSIADIELNGPEETQAGSFNSLDTTVSQGFFHHPLAWKPCGEGSLVFFAHPIDFSKIN